MLAASITLLACFALVRLAVDVAASPSGGCQSYVTAIDHNVDHVQNSDVYGAGDGNITYLVYIKQLGSLCAVYSAMRPTISDAFGPQVFIANLTSPECTDGPTGVVFVPEPEQHIIIVYSNFTAMYSIAFNGSVVGTPQLIYSPPSPTEAVVHGEACVQWTSSGLLVAFFDASLSLWYFSSPDGMAPFSPLPANASSPPLSTKPVSDLLGCAQDAHGTVLITLAQSGAFEVISLSFEAVTHVSITSFSHSIDILTMLSSAPGTFQLMSTGAYIGFILQSNDGGATWPETLEVGGYVQPFTAIYTSAYFVTFEPYCSTTELFVQATPFYNVSSYVPRVNTDIAVQSQWTPNYFILVGGKCVYDVWTQRYGVDGYTFFLADHASGSILEAACRPPPGPLHIDVTNSPTTKRPTPPTTWSPSASPMTQVPSTHPTTRSPMAGYMPTSVDTSLTAGTVTFAAGLAGSALAIVLIFAFVSHYRRRQLRREEERIRRESSVSDVTAAA